MSKSDSFSILSLQPFYGGSHKQFIDAWIKHSRLRWQQMTLPDRHWKWRMRHSAIEFARQVDAAWNSGNRWEAILCTDMLNLAEFKGLLKTRAVDVPFIAFFHENQFEYPVRNDQPRDLHFAFTNLTTALAADQVWFNSAFNFRSMIYHLKSNMKIWPDYQPVDSIAAIESKANIHPPGIEFGIPCPLKLSKPIHILWAARWEHDKNPEQLFEIVDRLEKNGTEFRLSVIGQQFAESPATFDELKQRFDHRIESWGYQRSRKKYQSVLADADLILSTAVHEFFGISAIEAIAAGCIPMLPNRLAYPELLNVKSNPDRSLFLFEDVDDAVEKIVKLQNNVPKELVEQLVTEIRTKFECSKRASEMDSGIESLIAEYNTNQHSIENLGSGR